MARDLRTTTSWAVFTLALSTVIIVACSSSSSPDSNDAGAASASRDGSAVDGGQPSGDDTSLPGTDGGATAPSDAALVDAPDLPAGLACSQPIGAADVSKPTTVVGSATGGCTEAALAAAVKKGGVVTFDCGGPTTIKVTTPLELPRGVSTTIDGGGMVILDGGGVTRIVHFDGGGYRTTSTVFTLQHLTFQNGHATGTKLAIQPAPCSQGYDTDAGGGAVFVLDAVLHVLDCTFINNSGQTPGPDVAGGAVYVNGSKGTVIVGSRFGGNTASNGGGVGSLNSDLAVYTSTFSGNSATGTGQNTTGSACPSKNHEIGDGGSGGAVYMDGGSDGNTIFCGDVFSKNHANALGGTIFRVFDGPMHDVDIDVSTFDGNVANGPVGTSGAGPGGGSFYFHNANVVVHDSTISNNTSPGCGGVQADGSTLDFTNVTLSDNVASSGVGGAVCIFSKGGTLKNCTLAGNEANGGSSYSNFYSAAIFGATVALDNCIVADNTTMNTMGRMTCSTTETGTNTIQWPKTKVAGGGADTPCIAGITFSDPMLGALADHGGPTLTMAAGATEPVVQIGTGCPATDQTGKARKTPCTIGALEN